MTFPLILDLIGHLIVDIRESLSSDCSSFDNSKRAYASVRKIIGLSVAVVTDIDRLGFAMGEGMSRQGAHLVIVVGAGPAGMSVANIMSKAGHEVDHLKSRY